MQNTHIHTNQTCMLSAVMHASCVLHAATHESSVDETQDYLRGGGEGGAGGGEGGRGLGGEGGSGGLGGAGGGGGLGGRGGGVGEGGLGGGEGGRGAGMFASAPALPMLPSALTGTASVSPLAVMIAVMTAGGCADWL